MASQALAEVQRFENRVQSLLVPGSNVTEDEVQLRFEILFNRLNVLRGSDLREWTEADPEQAAFLEAFAAALTTIEPMVAPSRRPGHRAGDPR